MAPGKSARDQHAQTVVDRHVLYAMGAGLIPVPVADLAALATFQVRLVSALGAIYGVANVESRRSKTIVITLFRSLGLSTIAVGGLGSLAKLAPGLGTLFGTSTIAALAGSLTYATGVIFKNHFAQGGTLEDFDLKKQKEHFRKAFLTGKRITRKYRSGTTQRAEVVLEGDNDLYALLPIYCIFKPKLGRTGKVYLKSYVAGKRPEKYIGAMGDLKERYATEDLTRITDRIIADHREEFLASLREKQLIKRTSPASGSKTQVA